MFLKTPAKRQEEEEWLFRVEANGICGSMCQQHCGIYFCRLKHLVLAMQCNVCQSLSLLLHRWFRWLHFLFCLSCHSTKHQSVCCHAQLKASDAHSRMHLEESTKTHTNTQLWDIYIHLYTYTVKLPWQRNNKLIHKLMLKHTLP